MTLTFYSLYKNKLVTMITLSNANESAYILWILIPLFIQTILFLFPGLLFSLRTECIFLSLKEKIIIIKKKSVVNYFLEDCFIYFSLKIYFVEICFQNVVKIPLHCHCTLQNKYIIIIIIHLNMPV